jgi:hypothetical protein
MLKAGSPPSARTKIENKTKRQANCGLFGNIRPAEIPDGKKIPRQYRKKEFEATPDGNATCGAPRYSVARHRRGSWTAHPSGHGYLENLTAG